MDRLTRTWNAIWANRPLVIGHRGARAYAPENTIESFEKAVLLGCDMIEFDVHMSYDNVPVVFHDDSLIRCTNVLEYYANANDCYISSFTWDELRKLDAGSWYSRQLDEVPSKREDYLQSLAYDEIELYVGKDNQHYKSGSVKIPSLDEVIQYAKTQNIYLNIEIKTIPRMYASLTESVVNIVSKNGLESRTIISSFDHEQLVIVRECTADIATAVLSSDRLACKSAYLEMLGASAYHPGCYGDYDTLGFGSISGKIHTDDIRKLRNSNYGVNVWTSNKGTTIRDLIASGVTGVITDYPNRVIDILHEIKGVSK